MIKTHNKKQIEFRNETVESINYQREEYIYSSLYAQTISKYSIPLMNSILSLNLKPLDSISPFYAKYIVSSISGYKALSEFQNAIKYFNSFDYNHATIDGIKACGYAIGSFIGFKASTSTSLSTNTIIWLADAVYSAYDDIPKMNQDLNLYNIAENYIKTTGENHFVLEI